MTHTIFNENCFSKDAKSLYDRVVSQDKIKRQMAIIDDYNTSAGAHGKGVAQMVAEYATAGIVDLNPIQVEKVVRIAVLHDLGKLSVSNTILRKPGRLSSAEWLEMQKHPVDGYHRYAMAFDACEALPVLMHHTLQLRDYPTSEEQKQAIAIHDISINELNNEEVIINTLMIAIADHFEARYPIANIGNPLAIIRSYSDREYSVADLPILVKASFIEAGKVQRLDIDGLVGSLIECSQEALLAK